MSSPPGAPERESAAAATEPAAVPGGVITRRAAVTPFEVHLENFSGPFDLLLGLISKHKLDITEIALATVTDEFVAFIRQAQQSEDGWDLSQATEFLVVASTLLDLKAARLLPQAGPEDEEDLALIEARDILFARLLQYRAFKDIAHTFGERMATAGRRHPRSVALEPHLAALLPELVMTVTPEQLAVVAARAMAPKTEPSVGLTHLHAPQVSVREQAGVIGARLRRERVASFRSLVADADSTLVVVARFLALLELFRESAIGFEQAQALGDLTVRWTGPEGEVEVTDEFDEPPLAAPDPAAGPAPDPSPKEGTDE
ncbi:segregation/condensation protein A [Phycicoccus endophyticus]|uniref:Segregation and condensation protein A n=1 Tax=Phycicoccus endophyticus TaxID=1690220 RepID=A0A7G9R4N8_9MICO|nr:ScpA family protein [Phycicoccus endophyticus]NHI18467.1 segregation/condensation protein A [Phycicoccus endophyticus]QNN50563.1 segregation/condensation protein A [Phycicoccus endophyticus]GGL23550.1 segregation/condensation protein A [Phycicoccus endophyticus]